MLRTANPADVEARSPLWETKALSQINEFAAAWPMSQAAMEAIIKHAGDDASHVEFLDALQKRLEAEASKREKGWNRLSRAPQRASRGGGASAAAAAGAANWRQEELKALEARRQWEAGAKVQYVERFDPRKLHRAILQTGVETGLIDGLCSTWAIEWLHRMLGGTNATQDSKKPPQSFNLERLGARHFMYGQMYPRILGELAASNRKKEYKAQLSPEELSSEARLRVYRKLYPTLVFAPPVRLGDLFIDPRSYAATKDTLISGLNEALGNVELKSASAATAAAPAAAPAAAAAGAGQGAPAAKAAPKPPRSGDWACLVSMGMGRKGTDEKGHAALQTAYHAIALCRRGDRIFLMDQNIGIMEVPAAAIAGGQVGQFLTEAWVSRYVLEGEPKMRVALLDWEFYFVVRSGTVADAALMKG